MIVFSGGEHHSRLQKLIRRHTSMSIKRISRNNHLYRIGAIDFSHLHVYGFGETCCIVKIGISFVEWNAFGNSVQRVWSRFALNLQLIELALVIGAFEMRIQMVASFKTFAAQIASKWSFACVNSFVHIQTVACAKSLAAVQTLKLFVRLFAMRFLVLFQVLQPFVPQITNVALYFSTVPENMLLTAMNKQTRLGEKLFTALVARNRWLFTAVFSLDMVVQTVFEFVAHSAMATFERIAMAKFNGMVTDVSSDMTVVAAILTTIRFSFGVLLFVV